MDIYMRTDIHIRTNNYMNTDIFISRVYEYCVLDVKVANHFEINHTMPIVVARQVHYVRVWRCQARKISKCTRKRESIRGIELVRCTMQNM